jgi:mitochondrial import inner membrane translocase subunit TIM13
MDYSGRASGGAGAQVDEQRVMQEVESTMRMQFLQEFYQTVRDKCFKYCISSPGTSLSGSDQKCLSRCTDWCTLHTRRHSNAFLLAAFPFDSGMDRYQDATNIVSKAVLSLQGLEQ